MESPRGSPFLAQRPHMQPVRGLKSLGGDQGSESPSPFTTDAWNTGLTHEPRAASACIKGSGTV